MGVFLVRADQYQKPTRMIRHRNKDLKIILMLCKNASVQHSVLRTEFCIVGDSICWKYPKEKVIHTLKLQEMNELELPSLQFVKVLASNAGAMVKEKSINMVHDLINIPRPVLKPADDESSDNGLADEPSDAQAQLV